MNNKSLSTLEYNKIISRLVSFACSDGAKQILHKLEPMTDIDKINTALDYTNDAPEGKRGFLKGKRYQGKHCKT